MKIMASDKKEVEIESEKPKETAKNGTETPSTSSSPSKTESEVIKTAMQNLAAGRRHLLVSDPNAAVTSLALACQLLGQHYGETAKECGEAYFYYGKALLELARMEAGVLDNVLDGVPDGEDTDNSQVEDPEKCTDEEKETIAEQVGEALEENFDELQKLEKDTKKEKEGQKASKEEDNEAEAKVESSKDDNEAEAKVDSTVKEENGKEENKKMDESEENSADDEENEEENEEEQQKEDEEKEPEAGPSTSKDEKKDGGEEKAENESIGSNDAGTSDIKDTTDKCAIDQEDEEDPSNLQLAWEMLELAKTIFDKHADSLKATDSSRMDLETKLSETYQTLGELSIENENYPQAIEDLTMCLKRRMDLLPEDSRCIAETHYQLGVALGFNLQFDEAVGSLQDAISVLQTRIDNLKEKKESQDPTKKQDAFYSREREITEIEGLIPEIHEKIADTRDMKEETYKKLGDRRLMDEAISAQLANGDQGSSKATSNISHLMKKRKKSDNDEAVAGGSGEVKKPHLDTEAPSSSTNGHATNGK